MKKVLNKDYISLERFVDDLATGLFGSSGSTLHDGRNTVKLFVYEGKKYVVKRFKRPHIVNRVAYTFFRRGKAQKGYENAMRLLEKGINTPVSIGYVIIKERGLIAYSYLVTEYTDWQPIVNGLQEDNEFKQFLAESLIDYTVKLHELGINHGDYNKTNILYQKTGNNMVDFMLIDVNRMSFGRMSKKDCLSSIKRMFVEQAPAAAFVSKYAEKRGWNEEKSLAIMHKLMSKFIAKRNAKKQFKQAKQWVGL